MTKNEYQQLVEFMAPRFDELKHRLTRVEVGVEENRHRIQAVAEGVTTVDRKLERFKEEVAGEFRAVREEMATGFAGVRDRFELQDASLRDLSARMDRREEA